MAHPPEGYPAITGQFELHVFVLPLNPDPEMAARFDAACRAGSTPTSRMKGLLLQLDYQGRGFVGVLQSSRYCSGTVADALREVARDAALLRAAGFEVIREKIEAVDQDEGVPRTSEEARAMPPGLYFEYHVLIDRAAGEGGLEEQDMASLRGMAEALTKRMGSPVPLSYNAFKPGQRFLNLRTYGLGRAESEERVAEVSRLVQAEGRLKVVKVIGEYICSDTNKAVDNGWLEPLP